MIPELVSTRGSLWPTLPPGIHTATLQEVEMRFATNPKRTELFAGLMLGITQLRSAGCKQIFLDGSFVSGKQQPNDYDLCWDPIGVHPERLDPILWEVQYLRPPREKQQRVYRGDYFQASMIEGGTGRSFLDFFCIDKHNGQQKGIINIKLAPK